MAAFIYKLALFLIGLSLFLAGGTDLLLYLTGQQTISAWLRLNPEWWWGAVTVTGIFILCLCVHLFG